jgi:hypothetical protein
MPRELIRPHNGERYVRRSRTGKRVQFDPETWLAIDLLARDRMSDFQELADEAFRDLLKKHRRSTNLKSALRQSVSASADMVPLRNKRRRKKGRA